MMKLLCGITLLLTLAISYYIYMPLPATVCEPWKLMLVGVTFRTITYVADFTHYLGLIHHIHVNNFAVASFERFVPLEYEEVQTLDTEFSDVQVRVYQPAKQQNTLRRGVVFIHGGGWALGTPSYWENLWVWSLYQNFKGRKQASTLNERGAFKGQIRYQNTLRRGIVAPLGDDSHSVFLRHSQLCPEGTAELGSYDSLCRKMSSELDAVVVTVDYRMSPDVRFPVQYEECVRAARHFLQRDVLAHFSVDPERVAVCGDSAGGNLAAAVAQQIGQDSSDGVRKSSASLRNSSHDGTRGRFKLQVLIYPVLQALDFNTASYQQNQNIPILYSHLMARYWLEYLGADPNLIHTILLNNHTALNQAEADPHRSKLDWTVMVPKHMRKHYTAVFPHTSLSFILQEIPAFIDARAAPLLAEQEVLRTVPRAYIMTCEHDVLRDDGMMYAHRLELVGIPVTHQHYEDGFHGCLSFGFWPLFFSVGIQAVEDYITWLNDNL